MAKKEIKLSKGERRELESFCKKGVHSVQLVRRAKIILELDISEGRKTLTQGGIATKVGISRQTVNNVKQDFLAIGNVSAFLQRKKRETPPNEPKITGEVEAHIIALACSEAPEGRARWTLSLLADKMVELSYIDSISSMSVCRILKKLNLSLT